MKTWKIADDEFTKKLPQRDQIIISSLTIHMVQPIAHQLINNSIFNIQIVRENPI